MISISDVPPEPFTWSWIVTQANRFFPAAFAAPVANAMRVPLMLLVLCVAPNQAAAQLGSGETYTPEELQRHFQNVADAYKIHSGRNALTLRDSSLMHWQNSVRQQ